MATNPVSLSSASPLLLPPTITSPIFNKAAEQSAVMRLARRVPLSVNATTQIPVPMDIPTAGWVSEGAAKPVATGGVGVKTMTGKKVALLVPVSEEVVRSNAAGLYDQLVQDLPTAISRAFDYAAIHGKDLKSGGNGPFGDYLTMTPNAQVIGSTAANAAVASTPTCGRVSSRSRTSRATSSPGSLPTVVSARRLPCRSTPRVVRSWSTPTRPRTTRPVSPSRWSVCRSPTTRASPAPTSGPVTRCRP
jgi:hypothetical protein